MTASSLGSKNAEKFPVDFEKILLYHVRSNTYNKRPLHASRLRRETLRQRWLPNPSLNRGGETLTQVKGGER